MSKSDPTPIPASIAARRYYGFHILIEGMGFEDLLDQGLEAERLKTSLLGTLSAAYPDRWSSVAVDAGAHTKSEPGTGHQHEGWQIRDGHCAACGEKVSDG